MCAVFVRGMYVCMSVYMTEHVAVCTTHVSSKGACSCDLLYVCMYSCMYVCMYVCFYD
jgi:hypothetical protein